MKSGVIVYVAGIAPKNWSEEQEVIIRDAQPLADLVEVITTRTGHLDVSDAWRAMLTKGMSMVTCKMAVFGESGEIEFTGQELRLCG